MTDESSRWRGIARAMFGRTGGNVASVALLLGLVYVHFFSGVQFFLVPSASMEPTLLRNDYIVTSKEASYHHGDIVVLTDPESDGDYIVKRVVALGGERVQVVNGLVCVNDHPLREPYIKELPKYEMPPVDIPDDGVFLLGDNRNDSEDSHVWKLHWTSTKRLVGKVRFIYSPLHRFGRVRSHTFEK